MVFGHGASWCFDRVLAGIPRPLADILDRFDLRFRQTTVGLWSSTLQGLMSVAENVGGRIESLQAGRQIVDHTIDSPVKSVAGLQDGLCEELLVRCRKCRIQDR